MIFFAIARDGSSPSSMKYYSENSDYSYISDDGLPVQLPAKKGQLSYGEQAGIIITVTVISGLIVGTLFEYLSSLSFHKRKSRNDNDDDLNHMSQFSNFELYKKQKALQDALFNNQLKNVQNKKKIDEEFVIQETINNVDLPYLANYQPIKNEEHIKKTKQLKEKNELELEQLRLKIENENNISQRESDSEIDNSENINNNLPRVPVIFPEILCETIQEIIDAYSDDLNFRENLNILNDHINNINILTENNIRNLYENNNPINLDIVKNIQDIEPILSNISEKMQEINLQDPNIDLIENYKYHFKQLLNYIKLRQYFEIFMRNNNETKYNPIDTLTYFNNLREIERSFNNIENRELKNLMIKFNIENDQDQNFVPNPRNTFKIFAAILSFKSLNSENYLNFIEILKEYNQIEQFQEKFKINDHIISIFQTFVKDCYLNFQANIEKYNKSTDNNEKTECLKDITKTYKKMLDIFEIYEYLEHRNRNENDNINPNLNILNVNFQNYYNQLLMQINDQANDDLNQAVFQEDHQNITEAKGSVQYDFERLFNNDEEIGEEVAPFYKNQFINNLLTQIQEIINIYLNPPRQDN